MSLDFVTTIIAYCIAMQEEKLRKGLWFEEEDELLTTTVALLGERRWDALAKASGLKRSGKSCRLRWMNYLRPNLKHGQINTEEERIIIQLHAQWGNKWSRIARRLPGRTDNEIKNYWRSHLSKRSQVDEQQVPCDTVTPSTSNGDCISGKDDISGTSINSCDRVELSNLAIINSPYEHRLSDWMPCCSYEKSEMNHEIGGCCSLDVLYSGYTTGISKDCVTGIWDSLGSIWDQD